MAYSRLDGYILTGLQTLPLRMGVTGRKRNYILLLQLISSGALNKYKMPSVCLICSCAVEPASQYTCDWAQLRMPVGQPEALGFSVSHISPVRRSCGELLACGSKKWQGCIVRPSNLLISGRILCEFFWLNAGSQSQFFSMRLADTTRLLTGYSLWAAKFMTCFRDLKMFSITLEMLFCL